MPGPLSRSLIHFARALRLRRRNCGQGRLSTSWRPFDLIFRPAAHDEVSTGVADSARVR
jgi:hypothetical protein